MEENIIELFIDEENDFAGIEAISIVENPAIEEDFIALKAQEIKLAEVDAEKRILMGAALIPDKKIYRHNGEEEYYIFFSKETVRKASELFLTKGKQNNSTLEHEVELNGLSVVESWIIEDEKKDKSAKYNLNLPVGTWMVSVKVNNDQIWEEFVKEGKVKGFSIEGFFADKIKASKMNKEQEADLLLSKITSIVKGERVELGLIDDALKYIKGVEVFGKNIDIGEKQLKSAIVSMKVDIEDLQGDINMLKKGLTKVEAASKDLGVNPNSIPKYKEALKAIEYGEKQLQKGKQLLK